MGKKILLTGRPGCGKTTVIQKVLASLRSPCGGFFTGELRREGRRVGFEIITLDGQRGVLSHTGYHRAPSIGRYGVDLQTLDELAVGAIRSALAKGELVVIDEIGPMEILSTRFQKAVLGALESPSTLLGTIVWRSMPFTDEIKRRSTVKLIEVTPNNRDRLPKHILALLGESLDQDS